MTTFFIILLFTWLFYDDFRGTKPSGRVAYQPRTRFKDLDEGLDEEEEWRPKRDRRLR